MPHQTSSSNIFTKLTITKAKNIGFHIFIIFLQGHKTISVHSPQSIVFIFALVK